MKLKKIYLRYSPPGLILESLTCERNNEYKGTAQLTNESSSKVDLLSSPSNQESKKLTETCRTEINLLHLSAQSNTPDVADEVIEQAPWARHQRNKIEKVILKLQDDLTASSLFVRLQQTFRFADHVLPLTNVTVNTDGTKVATGSYDRTARIQFLEEEISKPLIGHSDVVYDVSFVGRHDELLATGSYDCEVRLWNCSDGTCELLLGSHCRPVTFVGILSCDPANFLVSASLDSLAKVWDLQSGECCKTLCGHYSGIIDVQSSKRSQTMYTASFDGTARMWDLRNEKCVGTISLSECQLNCVRLNWPETQLVTASTDSCARLYDLRSFAKAIMVHHHDAEVVDVAWDCRGRHFATGSMDTTACIIDSKTANLEHTCSAHSSEVTRVMFDSSGMRLFTAGEDGLLCLWDAENGHCLQASSGHKSPITSVAFCQKKKILLTGSVDRTSAVWAIKR